VPYKRQAELYRFLYYNPSATLKEAAEALHIPYNYARAVKSRLMHNPKYRNFDACPECGTKLVEGVCPHCGIDFTKPAYDNFFGSHSPVVFTLPGGGLGTGEVALKFNNALKVVSNQLDRWDDVMLTRIKRAQKKGNKKLAQVLPNDPEIHNYASRLLYREIVEYATKYPSLRLGEKTIDALLQNVVNQLKREDKRFVSRLAQTDYSV